MKILDLFFPTGVKCIFCGCETDDYGICDNCYNSLPILSGNICSRCGGRNIGEGMVCSECEKRKFHFKRCYCVLEYRDLVQEKILSFKRNGNVYIGRAFARLVAEKFKSIDTQIDLVIPVPINENRRKERGFNQSEILCEEIDENKLCLDVMKRIKDTPHQTGLGRKNREVNLTNAFKVMDKSKIKGKVVLVVDDIYTTGSTINECARTLKSAGAKEVYALCLARTPFKMDKFFENTN